MAQRKVKGRTFWFTGLYCSGKTTHARELVTKLKEVGRPVIWIDSDSAHNMLSFDLGYCKHDKEKHDLRIANLCYLININDVDCVVSTTSHDFSVRIYARDLIQNFVEIYIKCSLENCVTRDKKDMYNKALKGVINDFVGIQIPYEHPKKVELVLDTEKHVVSTNRGILLKYVRKNRLI